MTILAKMPHTCRKLIRTRTSDPLGGARDDYAQDGLVLRCWRQAASDGEVQQFAKRGINVTNKVYFTANPELTAQHVLEIGGQYYEVKSVSDPDAAAGLGVVWRVMVQLSTVGATPYRQTN